MRSQRSLISPLEMSVMTVPGSGFPVLESFASWLSGHACMPVFCTTLYESFGLPPSICLTCPFSSTRWRPSSSSRVFAASRDPAATPFLRTTIRSSLAPLLRTLHAWRLSSKSRHASSGSRSIPLLAASSSPLLNSAQRATYCCAPSTSVHTVAMAGEATSAMGRYTSTPMTATVFMPCGSGMLAA